MFPDPTPLPPPVPLWVEYDGATRKSRTRRWFPNGLDRTAREFYRELEREGKRPKVLAEDEVPADDTPVKKPAKKTKKRRKKLKQAELFDTRPDQLPD